jgi:hypothetical protein
VDVRVYGAGRSGDKSFDHVAMVAHRIAHLEPDEPSQPQSLTA